jgi:predicted transcriptional regulator
MQSASTTIRIDREVHQRLVRIAHATGRPLNDTVGDAVGALERSLFADRVAAEFAELHANPDAWSEYLAEGDLAVGDGVA